MIVFKEIAYALAIILLTSQTLSASSLTRQIWSADYIVCIDGGGSKTSLQVINSKGQVLDIERDGASTQSLSAGSTNISVVGFQQTKNTLEGLLQGIKVGPDKKALIDIQNKSIICGLSGLSSNIDKIDSLRAVFTSFGFQNSHIAFGSDVDIAKNLIGTHGAILIAGTGSICFSKKAGKEIRIGGYGWAFDDGGSGFYFGKQALVAAWSHLDQEKEPFILTEKLCSLFKVTSISDVRKLFYVEGVLKSTDIAKAAPLVFEAAFAHNNAECKAIVDEGAAELAKLINIAVKDSQQADFPIYLIGGIFKDKHTNEFIKMIRQKVAYEPGLKFINIARENIAIKVIERVKF